MHVKYKRFIFVLAAIVGCFFLATFLFYSIPFIKTNMFIKYANCGAFDGKGVTSSDSAEGSSISFNDMRLLQLTENRKITEDSYVSLKTKRRFIFKGVFNIECIYDIKATIVYPNDGQADEEYSGSRIINWHFQKMKWKAESVEIVE